MRTFRVFVSSTFNDLREERDALQAKVFPVLRHLCIHHGYRFQAIDLRWGISEAAGRRNRTMQICLEELKRCQVLSPRPNFLVLLGDRYGWRPLPEHIPANELALLAPHLTPDMAECLYDSYCLDENAVEPVFVLMNRSTEKELIDALSRAAAACDLTADQRIRYGASATHQEIYWGALQAVEAERHVYAFSRRFVNLNALARNEDAARQYLDTLPCPSSQTVHDNLSYRHLEELRGRLKARLGENFVEYEIPWTGIAYPPAEHLGELPESFPDRLALLESDISPQGKNLCLDVFLALGRVILSEIRQLDVCPMRIMEDDQNLRFAREVRSFDGGSIAYLPRKADRNVLEAFLDKGETGRILVVHGPPGIGKSALLANTASFCREYLGWNVVERYVGASAMTATGPGLLESINTVLAGLYSTEISVTGNGPRGRIDEFQQRISSSPPNNPLIIVLDGLDLLPDSDPLKSITWIPLMLPPHVRLLLSTESISYRVLTHLELQPFALFHQMTPMNREDAENCLIMWLDQAGRRLNPSQREAVLSASLEDGLPLSLRIAFLRARGWKSFDVETCGYGLEGIVSSWISDLQRDENHGPAMIREFFQLLHDSREGLMEDELLDLLSSVSDQAVLHDFFRRSPDSPRNVNRLPVAPWARLHADIAPLLRQRSSAGQTTMDFMHPTLGTLITGQIPTAEEKKTKHKELLDYFKISDSFDNQDSHFRRKLVEYPYQLAVLGMSDDLSALLLDPHFLTSRLQTQGIHELLADFSLTAERSLFWAKDRFKDVESLFGAILQATRILSNRPEEFVTQMHWRLGSDCSENIKALLDGLRSISPKPWICLEKHSDCAPSPPKRRHVLEGHTGDVRYLTQLLSGRVLVSGGDDGTLRFWNLSDMDNRPKVVEFPDGRLAATAASSCGNYLITGAGKGVISFWSADGSRLGSYVIPGNARIQNLTISRSFLFILTKSTDLLAWKLPKEEFLYRANFAPEYCLRSCRGRMLTANYDSDRICIADDFGGVFTIEMGNRHDVSLEYLRHGSADFRACSLLLSTHGHRLFAGCSDGTIWMCLLNKINDCKWIKINRTKDDNSRAIRALALTSDNAFLYAGSEQGEITRFALDGKNAAFSSRPLLAEGNAVHALLLNKMGHDKDYLVCARQTPHIQILSTEAEFVTGHQTAVRISALTSAMGRHGEWGAVGDYKGHVTLFNMGNRQFSYRFPVHPTHIASLAATRDGRFVVAGAAGDGMVGLVDMTHPMTPPTLSEKQAGCIQALLVPPITDRIMAINDMDDLFVLSLPKLSQIDRRKLELHRFRITAAVGLSTNEEWLVVTGSQTGELAVCDQNLVLLHRTSIERIERTRINVITPAGNDAVFVGTGNGDMVLFSVDQSGFKEQKRFPQHPGALVGIALPGNTWIFTACQDGCLRLWKRKTGELAATCTLDTPVSGCVEYSAARLFVGDQDGQVFFGEVVVSRQSCHS